MFSALLIFFTDSHTRELPGRQLSMIVAGLTFLQAGLCRFCPHPPDERLIWRRKPPFLLLS